MLTFWNWFKKKKDFSNLGKIKGKNGASESSASWWFPHCPCWSLLQISVSSIAWKGPRSIRWGIGYHYNLESSPLFDEKADLTISANSVMAGKRNCLPTILQPCEVWLVFPVQFEQNPNMNQGLDIDKMKDLKRAYSSFAPTGPQCYECVFCWSNDAQWLPYNCHTISKIVLNPS